MLVECGTRAHSLKQTARQIHDLLAKGFRFEPGRRPLWRDLCVEPLLYHELFSGSFSPARGNALLVGDAAGLLLPISGEGIGMALKSGLLAATRVVEASGRNEEAGDLYIDSLKEILSEMEELYLCAKSILEKRDKSQCSILMKEAWAKAMSIS